MVKYLIKDTTREERERIVAESLGNIDASCDGCSSGIVEMYQDYIDGKKELRQVLKQKVFAQKDTKSLYEADYMC